MDRYEQTFSHVLIQPIDFFKSKSERIYVTEIAIFRDRKFHFESVHGDWFRGSRIKPWHYHKETKVNMCFQ